jgi:hypothetical protein
MKTPLRLCRWFSAVIAAAALLCLANPSLSAPVTFYVDSSQSSLTLSGVAFGILGTEQAPGSLKDYWGGTIAADLSGGVLTFSGGCAITALVNPAGPFSTAPAPYPPGGDNYGVYANGLAPFPYGLVTVNGAYRFLTLDLTTGTATHGSAPAGVTLSFTGGQIDWGAMTGAGPFGGSSSMAGVNGPDMSQIAVSFDGTTLTLPVMFHTTGSNRTEDWLGTIVAVVPEPSSLALALAGLAVLAARRARRGA